MYLAPIKVSTISDQEFMLFVEEKIKNSWIIANNPYTNWFKRGNLNIDDLQRLIIELANYENFLYIAQCLKSMHTSVLDSPNFILDLSRKDLEENLNHNCNALNIHQTIDSHNIRYKLILNTAEIVGLDAYNLQPTKALKSSLDFGKKGLISLIGHKNPWVAAGASFANAIGASYWYPLSEGIQLFNKQEQKQISLSLFEANQAYSKIHYSTIKREIEHLFTLKDFNRYHFLISVEYFLKEFTNFWEGLCSEYLLRTGN